MTKIGRNDPCPCGSGKKYKKCCEAKDSAPRKLTAHKIEGEELANKTASISGLFQKMSFPPPVRQEETHSKSEEEASKPLEEASEELKKEERKDDSEPPSEDSSEKT